MKLVALDDAAWGSPWRHHRVGEKVALSLGLTLTALALPAWPGGAMVGAASLVIILGLARIRPRLLWYAMVAPAVFIMIGAVTVAISLGNPPADALWRWGWLSVSESSINRGLSVLGHGLGGTLAVMTLGTTTPMVDLLTWLRRLHIPVPLLEIASLTYRLLFVVLGTLLAVRESQTNRLGHLRPWRSAAALMGATLVRSWDRSARLARGLELRGFDEALVTTTLSHRRSWPLIGGTLALLAATWTISLLATGQVWQ